MIYESLSFSFIPTKLFTCHSCFFTGKTMASILTLGSYACFALFLLLSLHDINLRMMTQDISGIQDIYPSIESICIPAFLALNVVAGFRVFKTAKK